MAKVEFTAIVSSLTGRLSGSIFQRSVGGNQLRSIGWGVNRRTFLQQSNRVTLEYLASNWQTLSPAQQASWSGATGRARFESYVAQNFEYAWLSGGKFLTPTVPTPAVVPIADTGWIAFNASGIFNIIGYFIADQNFADDDEWFLTISNPVAVGKPPSTQFRNFKATSGLFSQDDQLIIDTVNVLAGWSPIYLTGSKVTFSITINKGTTRGTTVISTVTVG